MWVGMINLTFVLQSPKGRCRGNQLILKPFADVAMNDLYFLLWRSTTDWTIVKLL